MRQLGVCSRVDGDLAAVKEERLALGHTAVALILHIRGCRGNCLLLYATLNRIAVV